MIEIEIVPCLSDNYAYLLKADGAVAVVDPSEPDPVIRALEARGLRLTHILNTHHHFDHTGGNVALKEKYGAKIFGPKADAHRIPGMDHGLAQGDTLNLGNARASVLEIPAHTSGHIAFHFASDRAVFTGDTMFAMGCGRLFEGTPRQMWESLNKLGKLPPDTRVYCGHEYTASNARFAMTLDRDNAALKKRVAEVEALRAQNKPTIPSTIGDEIATNPFLRAATPELARAVGLDRADPVSVFAEIRRRKDSFKG
jgi:hydroxyacylglutathione hydrolase